jgi:hypothetical protein
LRVGFKENKNKTKKNKSIDKREGEIRGLKGKEKEPWL